MSFVAKLTEPPIPRDQLWWTQPELRDESKYRENCDIFERITGRQVVFNTPTNDMLDVFRSLRKPIFLVRHESLLQQVVNILLGKGLRKDIGGALTNVGNYLDVTKGCIITQKAPNGGALTLNGRFKTPYISFKCGGLGDIPLTHGLLALAYGVEKLIPVYTGAYEVSHLCHHSTCVNVEHLLVETSYANAYMRFSCQGYSGTDCQCRPIKCVRKDTFNLDDYREVSIQFGKKSVNVTLPPQPSQQHNPFCKLMPLEEWMELLDVKCNKKRIQPIKVDPAVRITTGKGKWVHTFFK
jgi:hypothetical protein